MISVESNTTGLDGFGKYVNGLKQGIKRQYDRSVNRDLSQQKWQGLFIRNVTAVLKQAYLDALKELQKLPLDSAAPESEQGATRLAAQVLEPFDGFIEELMQYALQKHRTTCAISNFPDEHNPSQDYIAEVTEETERDWSGFVLQVNALLSR